MALYRYQITPLSAFATPMRSDTLYGHLLWVAAQRHGEQRVSELIEAFAEEQPPFVLSSALPSGRLPLPPLPGISRQAFKEQFARQGQLCERLQDFKAFRKLSWWPLEQWLRLKNHLSQAALFSEWLAGPKQTDKPSAETPEQIQDTQPHVVIARDSGSVLSQGGLFFSAATWYRAGATLDLYVESERIELFEELFHDLSLTGFGADRSTGKGHFSFRRDERFDATPFGGSGSHRLSLSVCAAEALNEFEGYWAPFVKHGRAWSGFGEKNPFKKPFLAFAEGSLFSRMPQRGYVLRNIHSDPRIVQIGRPLTIPVTLEGHHAH